MGLSLVVVEPGLFATVQDLGRPGFRAWGVPVGGAFDMRSHELANALVGNPPGAATLELTLLGGDFEAECDLALALAGAAMPTEIRSADGAVRIRPIPGSFTLRRGARLRLGGARDGARAYLAVAGGWQTPAVLGSRSSEVPLRAGDRLPAAEGRIASRRPVRAGPPVRPEGVIRVVDGPDAGLVEGSGWEGAEYRVEARSDRMGLRLAGPTVPLRARPERASAPVPPGAVQVAGGRPIVLGVASGTMGGYPHVAQVVSADLPVLGQLRPGQAVRFRRIGLDEARGLDRLDRAERSARAMLYATAARDPSGSAPGTGD